MPNTITARRLYTDIGSIEFPVLDIAPDGTIADIYSDPKSLHNETSTLTAAFLDIHTHGAVGHDVMQSDAAGLARLQRFLATRGTAHYLPTTVTAAIDDTLRALENLANAIEANDSSCHPSPKAEDLLSADGGQAIPIGIHLEGPFLSHIKRGMHPPDLLQPPSVELFDRFFTAARGHIKLLTIAPEPAACIAALSAGAPSSPTVSSSVRVGSHDASPALDLIRHATAKGVRCSLGHTNATATETLAALDAGATTATHTFNAMRPLDHREPGILGTVLTEDRLFAELICDGVHVSPALVRLWIKSKGPDRAILVTDAMEATGMSEGDYQLGGTAVTVRNGKVLLTRDLVTGKETLAGSILTLDAAVSNLQRFTQASLPDATRLASHNPAAMLGKPELTRLAPGSSANLNRFSAEGKLIATYLRGVAIPTGRSTN